MLQHAAQHAFWTWTKAQLQKLATLLEVDVDAPADTFALVVALAHHILGDLAPERLEQILSHRTEPLATLTPADFPTEAVKEVMGDKDAKE
eukprot:1329320-Alexandrium_andersonii.AAC.1